MGGLLGSLHSRSRISAGLAALMCALVVTGCASSSGSPAPTESGGDAPAAEESAAAEPGGEVSAEQTYCQNVAMSMLNDSDPAPASSDESAAAMEAVGIATPGEPLCSVTYEDSVSGRAVMTIWVGDDTIAPQLIDALTVDRFTAAEEAGAGYAISTFTDGDIVAAVAPVGSGNAMSNWSAPWPDQFVTLLSVTLP